MTLVVLDRPDRHLGRFDVRLCARRLRRARQGRRADAAGARGVAAPRRGIGVLNGVLVACVRMPSIVVTLATMVVLREGLRWATEGAWIQDLPADFSGSGWRTGLAVARRDRGRCPAGGIRLGAAQAAPPAGRSTQPARTRGREARRHSREAVTTAVFTVAGALVGLAALLNSVRFNQIPSNTGLGLEMQGHRRGRGRRRRRSPAGAGSVRGTLLGVVLLGAIGPALTFLGVTAYWERALHGVDHPRRRRCRCAARPARRSAGPPQVRRREALPADERVHPAARRRGRDRAVCARSRRTSSTVANFMEISRLGVELGLLAIALTPVIVTGGIDLSVGAMMGLAAVLFGMAWQDWRLPIWSCAVIACWPASPGRAERGCSSRGCRSRRSSSRSGRCRCFAASPRASRGGAVNYTGFPSRFLAPRPGLSRGRRSRAVADVRLVVRWHTGCCCTARSIGRALYRDRVHAEGARYAGIPVGAGSALVYVLSGLVASAGGYHLRRASRAGKVGRRHRLRARRDHRRRARRHVGLRRARHARRHVARSVRASPSCGTACAWRRCRRSWRAC